MKASVPAATRCSSANFSTLLPNDMSSALRGVFTTVLLLLFPAMANAQSVQHFPGTTAVQATSSTQHVAVTIKVAGTLDSVRVLTDGTRNLDFVDAGATVNACAPTAVYHQGDVCNVDVTFTPTAPGRRRGGVVLVDNQNLVLGTQLMDGVATGPLAVIRPGSVETLAGSDNSIFLADGVPSTYAQLNQPHFVLANAKGDLFLSDAVHGRIRRVANDTRLITTYAGSGAFGSGGDGGSATQASLSFPTGLALDGAGNLYIADSGNNAIRRVDASTGLITTVAGSLSGAGFTGDGGLATAATLNNPNGLAFDQDGNLYIADTGNNAIRRVDAVTGLITKVAGGNGAGSSGDGGPAVNAKLYSPFGIAFAPNGTLYIADRLNNVIRQILAGTISLKAGNGTAGFSGDGGAATSAQLKQPSGVTCDLFGNLYIADTTNNRIRRVDVDDSTIKTVAGTGSAGYYGDGLNSDVASFYGLISVYQDAQANLLIADTLNNRVRRIRSNFSIFAYPVMKVGKKSAAQLETLENDGNDTLHFSALGFDQSALDASTTAPTSCGVADMAPKSSCTLGVQFFPNTVGNTVIGHLTLPSNATNTDAVVQLSGQVLSVEPTSLALASSVNPAAPAQAVTFTATVVTQATTVTGNVSFYDGSTQIGQAALGNATQSGSGNSFHTTATAAITVSNLTVGNHTITAHYEGDDNNAESPTPDPSIVETILQPTQTALTSSINPSIVTHDVTFTATVTPTSGNIVINSGTVTFTDSDSGVLCAAVPVNSSGIATCLTNNLRATEGSANPVISHTITASFSGNSAVAASSAQVSQVVNRIATTTMLSVNTTAVIVNGTVIMTATVTGQNGLVPTGAVGFYASTNPGSFIGARALGNAALDVNGIAVFTTAALDPGMNYVRAEYAGDSQNGVSNSSGIGVQVNKLDTITTLTPSANPVNAGAQLTLTATVAPRPNQPPSGAITGTVTFYDSGVQLGATQSITNGVAIISTTSLAVGTHPITAVFAENSFANTSTSVVLNQIIQKVTPGVTLSLSAPNTIAGRPLTFTVSVAASGLLQATGTVTFLADGSPVGQVTLNGQGAGTFTTSSLPVGVHNIVASYGGDSNFIAAASSAATETVRAGNTTLSLAASATQLTAGSALNLNGVLSSDGVLASSASVTLQDNGGVMAALTPSTNGGFAYSTSSLTVGTHTIAATYTGDANNAPATSQQLTVVVVQARTSAVLTTSKTPATLGGNISFRMAVSSSLANASGTVTFSDGATVLSTMSLSGTGEAVFSTSNLAIGAHTITATYSGDVTHAGSSAIPVSQQVVQGTSITMQSNSNPSIGGLPVDFAILVTPDPSPNGTALPVPSGTVNIMDGTNPLGTLTLRNAAATLHATALSVGTHNLTVTYLGDVNFQASTSTVLVQVVKSADTHATLTASASQISFGTSLALNATVTGNGDIPTGTVTFLDGGAPFGQVPVSSTGTANFATTTLSPGMHSISASYSGDSNNGPTISAPVSVQVQQSSNVLLVSMSNPVQTLETFILTAAVRSSVAPLPTGTVQFTSGATVLGTATLDPSGFAVLRVGPFPVGVYNIVASYSGDVANFASASSALPITVNLRPTTNAVTATAANKASGGQLSLISAIQYVGPVVPTGTVTFRNGTTVIGSSRVDGAGIATFTITTAILPASITTTYSGDTVYAGSSSATTVVPKDNDATDFTITIDPATLTVQTKKFVVAKIAIHSLGGFSDTLSVGCLGLPFAATCTFDKSQITLNADGTATVNVTVDTGSPLTSGGQTIAKAESMGSKAALCCLPAGALCALLLLRVRRKTQIASLLLLVVLAVLMLPLGGCGSIDVVSTPPGGYTFKISAAGKASGVTVSQTVNITVTQ